MRRRKDRRGRRRERGRGGKREYGLKEGKMGLYALKDGRVTEKELEAGRVEIKRMMGKEGMVWVRVDSWRGVTSKGKGQRMGKGKGRVDYREGRVREGQVVYEVGRRWGGEAGGERKLREALKRGGEKLSVSWGICIR
uniref:Ribosomal protein L16 n=1 Tax=Labyrinthula sp. TaxID=1678526 RepID=A0A7S6U9Q7_9STRA|nr:ribosomal protein L16 [Labyrinthula sp.]